MSRRLFREISEQLIYVNYNFHERNQKIIECFREFCFLLTFEQEAKNFPHNSVVQVRCKQFGVFKLIGDAHLICHNGVWKHRIPTCIPTTSLTNFTDESAPPSVLAKVISGSASIEPTGELAVYPGSTVHLECLFLRSAGEPEWSWTSTYRTYATGTSHYKG